MMGLWAWMTVYSLGKRERPGVIVALGVAFVGAVGGALGMVHVARGVTDDGSSLFGVLVGMGAGLAFAVVYMVVQGKLWRFERRRRHYRLKLRMGR